MNDPNIDSALPQRARPAHQPVFESHNRAAIIFLTVCTKDRKPILATDEIHKVLQTAWSAATHWLVGRYVIMPDHIHLFCAPGLFPAQPLAGWVRHWKTSICKSVSAEAGTFWQRDFWDTQLRGHESYSLKWEYVRNNPVRARLVSTPDEWTFQGELNILRWHE